MPADAPPVRPGRSHNPLSQPRGRFYRGRMSGNGELAREVLTQRLEALERPPLRLVELPAEDGGLDLLIYNEQGHLVDVSYAPDALLDPPVSAR